MSGSLRYAVQILADRPDDWRGFAASKYFPSAPTVVPVNENLDFASLRSADEEINDGDASLEAFDAWAGFCAALAFDFISASNRAASFFATTASFSLAILISSAGNIAPYATLDNLYLLPLFVSTIIFSFTPPGFLTCEVVIRSPSGIVG